MRNEGTASLAEMLPGLKAIQVTRRYKVNMSRKMSRRLNTHSRVFGILNLVNIKE